MEQSIGVFGEEVLLWACMLRQAPRRPPPDHVLRQANFLLDELKSSPQAQQLPVQSVDDGMFAIAALIDETAMALPDLRPIWSQASLQATRWMTNNAGTEFYERIGRVRQGPKTILATYVTVLGAGFLGRFGLPGADKSSLAQLRRYIAMEVGVDSDRDWIAGVLVPSRAEMGPSALLPRRPWYQDVWFGRGLAIAVLVGALVFLITALVGRFS